MSALKSKSNNINEPNTFLDNVNNKINNINLVEISLKKENYTLKEKIKELEYDNKTYLLKISELTKSRNILLEEQLINKRLSEELKIKQEIIEKLQYEILKEEKDKKEEQRIIENKFNAQLIYYKRLHDTGMAKENAASSIIKLNETQHNCILQLENKIDEIKQFYEKKIKDIELGHENRYSKLKKQMMEFLKNSQKNMAKNNEENLELNSKLTILYKNQMLNELESQSHQVEELLKERERQNKEIYALKEELKIHKRVEEIIKNKNNKYLNLINKINIKFNNIQEGEDKINENKLQNNNNNVEIEQYNMKKIENKYENKNEGRVNSVKLIKNNYKMPQMKNFNKYKNLIKYNEYSDSEDKKNKPSQKPNDLKNTKENNFKIFIKDEIGQNMEKDNNINNNEIYINLFKSIIILCNESLDKIIKNKKIISISKSNLFSENFDFNSLDNIQKYELIIEIMKKIFSFLIIYDKNDLEINNIKKKIGMIKIKDNYNYNYYLSNREGPNFTDRQKVKYNKIINVISKNNKNINYNKKEFPNIKNKKSEFFNKNIIKMEKNITSNELVTSLRVKSPNPLIRYIHLSKDKDKKIEDKKNNTFYKDKH